MTVFLVFYNGFHDIAEFIAVFSTRKKAEAYIKGCMSPSAYMIEDHQIDES
jgi:hypothetical protein